MENKDDILDDFIARISNQELLSVDDEDDFIDSVMDGIGEEASAPVARLRGWVIALRAVASIAAIWLVGMFFYFGYGVEDEGVAAQSSLSHNTDAAPTLPCVDGNSTPREILACYCKVMKEQKERQAFYNNLKI